MNGRENGRRRLSRGSRRPLPDRPRPAPDRGHLAVSLQGRLLAARADHHGRHRRHRHRALGHQGQGRRHAALPAPRRRLAHQRALLQPRQGADIAETVEAVGKLKEQGFQRDPRADRHPRPAERLRRRHLLAANDAADDCAAARGKLVDAALSRLRAASSSRPCAKRFGYDAAPPARHASSPDARSRRRGSARRSNPTGCSGSRTRCRPRSQEGFRIVRQHTATPLAVGEVFNTIWDSKTLIEEQLIDYIRATIVHAGGVTHLRRIADFAAIYHIRTGFHGADGHVAGLPRRLPASRSRACRISASRNIPATPKRPSTSSRAPGRSPTAICIPATPPGTASTSTRTLPADFPYQRAYLPVNRLEDGTLWHW